MAEPLLVTLIWYVPCCPTINGPTAVLVMLKSGTSMFNVASATLLPDPCSLTSGFSGLGSVVSLVRRIWARFTTVGPETPPAAMVALTVKVAEVPFGKSRVVLKLPTPLAAPQAAPAPVAAQVHSPIWMLSAPTIAASDTRAPLTSLGPAFLNVTV